MSEYVFENPITKEIVEVFQSMNQEHSFEKDGIKYNRVFTAPRAVVDGKINPFCSEDFVRKTANKKGTVGDLWETSRELSEKREKVYGIDPVKEDFLEKERKRRGGRYPAIDYNKNKDKVFEI